MAEVESGEKGDGDDRGEVGEMRQETSDDDQCYEAERDDEIN